MNELKPRIHDDSNGLDYVLVGDYYIPDLELPEERRPIGKWGRMHLRYLKEHRPITYTELTLSGSMGTYLADINEQAQERLELLINQMKAAEGVTEDLKRRDWWRWVQAMGSIQNRAEEIVLSEIVYL
ncbi:MAG: TnpV protein [Oscillospiraceae bacterium]|nr:TnpV protein [Oscillospiraceae bacterium]